MRVLLCSASFQESYGGPAVSVSRLGAALAELGCSVALWAPDGSAATSPVVRDLPGLERHGGPLAAQLGRQGRPDIIHDSGLWLAHHHRIAVLCRRAGLPRVVSLRGMLEPWSLRHGWLKKRLAWTAYQRRDLMRAAALHATAPAEVESARRLGLTVPAVVIPNGIDMPEQQTGAGRAPPSGRPRTSAGERRALFLSRVHPKKGLPLLLEAWSRLRPAGWRLEIAGPDELGHRAQLEAAVRRLGLDGTVTFLGPVYGAAKDALIAGADLFVLPSHSENFGMAIAEALSHGVTVLTTTATPWEALTEDGCGWRVEPTADALTGGLAAAVAATDAERAEMGARGRALVAARFTWRSAAEDMLLLYVSLL